MGNADHTLPGGAAFLIESVTECEPFTYEDFGPDELGLAATAEEFVRKDVLPHLADIENKKEGLMPALLRRAGELGLLMLEVPTEYGGLGLGKSAALLVAATASECGSFSVSMNAHTGIGTLPLVLYGNDEQRARYLPRLATGAWLAAYALSEPGSGSDALSAKARAVLSADGRSYRLNGIKQFITNAGFADLFTVFAKVDGEKFTAFLVERTFSGVSTGPEEHKLGIKGSSTRQLILEDVDVPVENVLGQIGQGPKIAFNILNVGRLKLGGIAAGGARKCLQLAVGYAAGRRQFGKPIVTFGVLQHKIATMMARIYAAESMSYRTSGLLDAAVEAIDPASDTYWQQVQRAIEEYAIEQSILKVYGSEALGYAADEALQMYGGYGYTEEYPLARHYRDARINRIFEGTNEINRLLIPGTLVKRVMSGALPLMDYIQQARVELAAGGAAVADRGPLAAEVQAVEAAKRLTAHIAGLLLERHAATLAQKQQHLELLSNMICEVYALDSSVARTLKLIRQRGIEGTVLEIDLTRVVAARCTDEIAAAARQLVANDGTPEEIEQRLQEVRTFSPYVPIGILDAQTRIAERVTAMYAPQA
ncbi:MAG TPA: acyl-CoA dehydrogenase family protein [Candidatus Acidoferrales bacterium]|nr:acyl-CoA dehydrogenase family protein [Candidatus Acidoferrales bacterium]